MKKLTSVLSALALVLSLAVTASASDYGQPPIYIPPVVQPNDNSGTATETVTDKIISDALNSDSPIVKISGSVVLQRSALSEIIKAGKPVTFQADTYKIVIDPADITNSAKAIDLNMDISAATGDLIIQPAASGDFGFELTIVIPGSIVKSTGMKAKDLRAYYIADNGDISEIDFVLNSDASISLKISHASGYIITDIDLLADLNDDLGNNSEDGIGDGDDFVDDTSDNGDVTTGTPDTTDNKNDKNPSTGVAIPLAAMGTAGIIAFVAKRTKK